MNEYGDSVEFALVPLERFLTSAKSQFDNPNSQLDLKNKQDMQHDTEFPEGFV